jgi:uncharacterized protein YjbI with pentapeptide repeats
MNNLTLLIIGWLLGLISSLLTGLVLFWLEGVRIKRNKLIQERTDNVRSAINWSLSDKKVSFRGMDFVGQNLSGVDLSEADFTDANFSRALLSGTIFKGAKLNRTNFHMANLNEADFRFANLEEARFSKAQIYNVNFDCAVLKKTSFHKVKDVDKNYSFLLSKFDETTKLPPKMLKELFREIASIENSSHEELIALHEKLQNEVED